MRQRPSPPRDRCYQVPLKEATPTPQANLKRTLDITTNQHHKTRDTQHDFTPLKAPRTPNTYHPFTNVLKHLPSSYKRFRHSIVQVQRFKTLTINLQAFPINL